MSNISGKTIDAIAPGRAHILVLTSDGLLYGYGKNNNYQLGDGTLEDRQFALATNVLSALICTETIQNIYSQEMTSIVTTSFGRMLIWGQNTVRKR